MSRRWRWCARPALLAALLWAAVAQGAEVKPLFAAEEPLQLTLEMPMAMFQPGVGLQKPIRGRLTLAGGAQPLDVEVTTRGHSRLEMCDLPPLKLNFDRDQLEGTVFAGQNKLKLVTHCSRDRKFRRYLLQEYAAYRSYNVLTDASFRVRLLDITYRDSNGQRSDTTRPAFFIEADREVASRLGAQEVEMPSVRSEQLDPDAITLLGLFHFMIGSTDWSLRKGRGEGDCCHNGLLLKNSAGRHLIVPYDFDQAGVVNADYALPARGLGIRSVRQRLFRGLCTGDERLARAIDLFNERRGAIQAQFPPEGMMRSANRRAQRYIDEFYEIANSAEQRAKAIGKHCRGNPEIWDQL